MVIHNKSASLIVEFLTYITYIEYLNFLGVQAGRPKSYQTDQTVRRRNLKLCRMVELASSTKIPRLAPIGLMGVLQRSKEQDRSSPGEILDYFGFFEKPTFQNQTVAERFSGEWMSIIKFQLTVAKGRQNVFERGEATFTKMAITFEQNEICTPNSIHICETSIWGHMKQSTAVNQTVH